MWPIKSRARDWPKIESLVPENLLDEYDGPRLFTVRSTDGDLLLIYQCAEDDERERFLLVPADDALILALEKNRLSIRDALTRRGWAWLVDRMRDGRITQTHSVDPKELPDTAMPRPSARLNLGPETLLRIRMIGEELTSEHVPASVVRRTVDAATGAVKALATHALSLIPSPGRPADEFRRYYDLPAVEFGFRSFEIAFGKPEPPKQLELDFEEKTLIHMKELLSMGLEWATANDAKTREPTTEWSATVEALAKLAPPRSGSVMAVEVSGTLAGQPRAPILLTRAVSSRISDERKLLSPERRARTYQGFVREFDKDKFTFILRKSRDENILIVSFSPEHYDDALLAFDTERPVTVVAEESPGTMVGELVSIVFDVSPHSNEDAQQLT
jgi:hypothetical protein